MLKEVIFDYLKSFTTRLGVETADKIVNPDKSWIKKFSVHKRYKFIRYLFFEIDENKFNIVPKTLLFLDLKKIKNNLKVTNMSITYTLIKNDNKIDSNVLWSLEEVSNVVSNHFYFYTGIDLGEIQNQKFSIISNNIEQTINLLSDNKVDSGNDIYFIGISQNTQ